MKNILSAFICIKGTVLSSEEARLLNTYNPAGLTLFTRNIQNPTQVKKLTDDIRDAVGRDDFLIAIDQEGGFVRRLRPPYWQEYVSQQQLGSIAPQQAEDFIKTHGQLIANDLKNLGINVNLSPVADTLHSQTTPALASRCFSSDPKTVSQYASILAQTYIGNGICPCFKHLPGHGFASTNPHLGLSVINNSIEEIEPDFLPLKQLAKFVPFAMTAHVIVPAIDSKPITQSQKGIEFIRKNIGFDGLLITDAIEMHALQGTLEEKVKTSLSAGCDLVCFCSGHTQNNPNIIEENEIVLKSSQELSEKTYKRLQKVTEIIKNSLQIQNIENLTKKYNEYVNTTKNTHIILPDFTENWSDKNI